MIIITHTVQDAPGGVPRIRISYQVNQETKTVSMRRQSEKMLNSDDAKKLLSKHLRTKQPIVNQTQSLK